MRSATLRNWALQLRSGGCSLLTMNDMTAPLWPASKLLNSRWQITEKKISCSIIIIKETCVILLTRLKTGHRAGNDPLDYRW